MIAVRCPRCRGNLFTCPEDGPGVWGCLQCGARYQAVLARSTEDLARQLPRRGGMRLD